MQQRDDNAMMAAGCLEVVAGALAITAAAVVVGAKAGPASGIVAWLLLTAVGCLAWCGVLVAASRGE